MECASCFFEPSLVCFVVLMYLSYACWSGVEQRYKDVDGDCCVECWPTQEVVSGVTSIQRSDVLHYPSPAYLRQVRVSRHTTRGRNGVAFSAMILQRYA